MTNDNALRTPRDAEMAGLLEELEASGGNISAFARAKGLSPWKLYGKRPAALRTPRSPGRRLGAPLGA